VAPPSTSSRTRTWPGRANGPRERIGRSSGGLDTDSAGGPHRHLLTATFGLRLGPYSRLCGQGHGELCACPDGWMLGARAWWSSRGGVQPLAWTWAWARAVVTSMATVTTATATAVSSRRRGQLAGRTSGRPVCLAETSRRRGHAHSAPERGPRPVGHWRLGLQRQTAAPLVVGTAGWVAAGSRRSGRVSWAVDNQTNTKKPIAVRAAMRAFCPSGRSLSSMRSPKLAAPMPNAQVAAYRRGRSVASRAHRSSRICGRPRGRRSRSCSGRGS
jgi:hypothetical protein